MDLDQQKMSIFGILRRQAIPALPKFFNSLSTMSVRTVSQKAFAIQASQSEFRDGRLTEQHLEQAVRHILQDGKYTLGHREALETIAVHGDTLPESCLLTTTQVLW